ncbi:MAG: MotA/TolQ/ExbB proton channel family protein [Planctomycetota bacterium]|nr:MotA/TolQ/ExbB proton channel family protein [Planctomycetota bacterium]
MQQFEFVIWMILFVLGYLTTHAVLERLLFHGETGVARQDKLHNFNRSLLEFKSLDFSTSAFCDPSASLELFPERKELGWLGPLLRQARGTRSELRELVCGYQKIAERFSSFLATMIPVGGYLGLMGTVMAFVEMSGSTQNFAELMPLAFQTTFAGLLISIPAAMMTGLLSPRAELILAQTDQVLDAIDDSFLSGQPVGAESASDPGLTEAILALAAIVETQQLLFDQHSRMLKQLDENVAAIHLTSPTPDSMRIAFFEAFEQLPLDVALRNSRSNLNSSTQKGKINGTSKSS